MNNEAVLQSISQEFVRLLLSRLGDIAGEPSGPEHPHVIRGLELAFVKEDLELDMENLRARYLIHYSESLSRGIEYVAAKPLRFVWLDNIDAWKAQMEYCEQIHDPSGLELVFGMRFVEGDRIHLSWDAAVQI